MNLLRARLNCINNPYLYRMIRLICIPDSSIVPYILYIHIYIGELSPSVCMWHRRLAYWAIMNVHNDPFRHRAQSWWHRRASSESLRYVTLHGESSLWWSQTARLLQQYQTSSPVSTPHATTAVSLTIEGPGGETSLLKYVWVVRFSLPAILSMPLPLRIGEHHGGGESVWPDRETKIGIVISFLMDLLDVGTSDVNESEPWTNASVVMLLLYRNEDIAWWCWSSAAADAIADLNPVHTIQLHVKWWAWQPCSSYL